MKVLVIGPHESPIIQRLIIHLKKRNHIVWLASYNAENKQDIINLGNLRRFSDYFKINKINKIVKELQPDIVHAHVVNHYGIMALKQPKPLVVALWGSDVMLAPHSGNLLKKFIFRTINFLVLRRANLCHTSAQHVAREADNQCSGALAKTKVFYWGLPLEKPAKDHFQKIAINLKKEFGLNDGEKYIVFPRGLDDVYSPKIVVKIINKLKKEIKNSKQIVVLKGFCSKNKEEDFGALIDLNEITYINRVLDSEELYYLYKNTFVHVSIPVSDSLGGGVVEPSLLGSFPILSNLPSYHDYSSKNSAHVMTSFEDTEIQKAVNIISEKLKNSEKSTIPDAYSAEVIIEKIEQTFREAIKIAVR